MLSLSAMCLCAISPDRQHYHHRPRVTNVAIARNDREHWINDLHSADVHCELSPGSSLINSLYSLYLNKIVFLSLRWFLFAVNNNASFPLSWFAY